MSASIKKTALQTGLSCENEFVVQHAHLATEVGSGLVAVFSTAMMIARMEAAAVECVQKYLSDGQTTVGTHVNVAHNAATPVGMKIRVKATLTAISANGKGLAFQVEARDAAGIIGSGEHQRVIVDKELFESRASRKTELEK